jgi:hypothetical protein
MSKNLCGTAIPRGVAHSCYGGISDMTTVEQIKKAFREARIEGEKNLSQGKIAWDEFADEMRDFEAKLRSMGVVL